MHRYIKRFGLSVGVLAVALLLTSCHALRENQDTYTYYDGNGAVYSMILRQSGTHQTTDPDFQHIVWNDINQTCVNNVTGGSWGTVGSSTHTAASGISNVYYISNFGTPPSTATIDCVRDEILDDPNSSNDNESIICNDPNTANDCQDPDGGGTGTYKLLSSETDAYQAMAAGDSTVGGDVRARTTAFIVGIRDWYTDNSNTGSGASGCTATAGARCLGTYYVACGVMRHDSTWLTAVGNGKDQTFAWSNLCP